MATGYEVKMYHDISSIAISLKSIADSLKVITDQQKPYCGCGDPLIWVDGGWEHDPAHHSTPSTCQSPGFKVTYL